jgi:hypothetical protein
MTSKNTWDGVFRQRLSRRRLLAAGLAVGAASESAACGGGGEAQPPKPTSSPTAGGPALESITVTYPGFPNWAAVHGPRAGARRVAQRRFESCRGHYRPNFGVYPLSLPPERRPTVEAAGANAHTDSHRPFLTSVVDRIGRASDGTRCAATGSVGWRCVAMKRRTGHSRLYPARGEGISL